MITLYDAARCPYCARVRIALAEKRVPFEPVAIDLSDRPGWIYEKNPAGRVPVNWTLVHMGISWGGVGGCLGGLGRPQ